MDTDRHIRMLQHVQDLTLRLLDATAAQAEADVADPPAKPTPHAANFTRLARTLQNLIELEHELATPPAPKAGAKPPRPPDDPRRAPLQNAFADALRHHPDRAARKKEANAAIDELLRADPDRTLRTVDLLQPVAGATAIPLDPARLTDEVLCIPPRPNPDAA